MSKRRLVPDKRGFLHGLLRDLIQCGWRLDRIPSNGIVPRNAMNLVLKLPDQEIRRRIFIYKVTTSGRSRPHERRVEITTTYESGLKKTPGFRDVVLGFDVDRQVYVGVDGARLRMGGNTHNASSFFDLEGFAVKKDQLLVNPRAVVSREFPSGIEYHAFFHRGRLADYLINQQEVHAGAYLPRPSLSNSRRQLASRLYPSLGDKFVLTRQVRMKTKAFRMSKRLIESVEQGDLSGIRNRQVTPEQLVQILNVCDEIGAIGEQTVLEFERRRLRKLGHHAQSARVERVSLRSVGEGFDILSFEDDGVTRRYLEVKSTIGTAMTVHLSVGEWKAAKRFGSRYYIVRVTEARNSPRLYFVPNPADLERRNAVVRNAVGWTLDLSGVISAGCGVSVKPGREHA